MEALHREVLSQDWIALIFMFSLGLLFLINRLKASKLSGHVLSIFNRGFIEIEAEEKYIRFSFFHIGLALFAFVMLSFSSYFIIQAYTPKQGFLMVDFIEVSSVVFLYLFVKYLLELLLINLFEIREKIAHFFFSKRSYSYSLSIGLFILNLLYFYSFQNPLFLLIGLVSLISIRFLLILFYNKNLIIKELFYFILYLCAFELAPLFILFKMIFK